MDEMIFSGAYSGWEYSVRFDLAKATEQDVAFALAHIHEQIEDRAFCHSGVNCDAIEKAIPEGNGIPDMVKFLESRKPGEWKDFLLRMAGKAELVLVAEAKFVCVLLSKNRIFAKLNSRLLQSSLAPLEQKLLEGQIAFIARYKEWISIKKMSMEKRTQDYEVAAILSSINTTLVNKSFDFLRLDGGLKAIADAVTKGKRKSFVNLTEALRQVTPSLTGDRIRDAFLLKCIFENLGFAPYANVDVLISAYPHLKVAKPRGRVAKV